MTSTAQIRVWWADFFKQGYDYRAVLLGREGVKMTRFTTDAWRALETALQTNGYGSASIVSTYYPRYIGGTTSWSLHSYSGVALDIDPADNPFIRGTTWDFTRCRFTEAQVNAVLDVRTNSGAVVWRWGGDFGDYMHWQLDCKPDDIESGIATEEGTMPPLDVWLDYIRIVDIEKMGADGIITPSEVTYFTTEPMWTTGNPQGNTDVNAADWENLYNAYRTRAPIWAV